MTKPRIVSAVKMEKLLFSLGFEKTRQKGSHAFYRHPDGRTTTVPHHRARDLSRPLIRDILKDIGLAVDDYDEALKQL